VDGSRPADARRGGPSPARRLVSTIWYPVDATGPRPLVVYSHGFLANRAGGTYLILIEDDEFAKSVYCVWKSGDHAAAC
jgi:hypothetical protein